MDKEFNSILEELSRLYLRLNGFVNQNLIIHSGDNGNSCGELDIIAVRLPYHNQDDRGVGTSPLLNVSKDRIQIIIGDCKNVKNREDLEFSPIRKNKKCIEKLIYWIGFQEKIDDALYQKFDSFLNVHRDKKITEFPTIELDTSYAKFDIKFMFFCPSLKEWDGNSFKYIHGQEMLDYIFFCLNRIKSSPNCSKTYNFENWNNYEWIVRYFKALKTAGTLDDLKKNYRRYYK